MGLVGWLVSFEKLDTSISRFDIQKTTVNMVPSWEPQVSCLASN